MSETKGAQGSLDAVQLTLVTAVLIAGTASLEIARVTAREATSGAWLGVGLGSAVSLLALELILAVTRRYPGQTLVGAARRALGPLPGALVGLVLVVWGHTYLGVLLREFAGVFLIPFMPETPLSAFVITSVLLLVYAAYQGTLPIARAIQVFFPLIIISLLLILGGNLRDFSPGFLAPLPGDNGWVGVGWAALFTLSLFAEAVVLHSFLPYLKRPEQARRGVLAGGVVAGASLLMITAVELGTFGGPLLTNLSFPTLSAARLVQIGLLLNRFESVFMVIWFVLSLLKLALILLFVVASLAELLGTDDYRPFCVPAGLIVAFTAFLPDNFAALLKAVGSLYRYGFLILLLPAAVLAASLVRGRGRVEPPQGGESR